MLRRQWPPRQPLLAPVVVVRAGVRSAALSRAMGWPMDPVGRVPGRKRAQQAHDYATLCAASALQTHCARTSGQSAPHRSPAPHSPVRHHLRSIVPYLDRGWPCCIRARGCPRMLPPNGDAIVRNVEACEPPARRFAGLTGATARRTTSIQGVRQSGRCPCSLHRPWLRLRGNRLNRPGPPLSSLLGLTQAVHITWRTAGCQPLTSLRLITAPSQPHFPLLFRPTAPRHHEHEECVGGELDEESHGREPLLRRVHERAWVVGAFAAACELTCRPSRAAPAQHVQLKKLLDNKTGSAGESEKIEAMKWLIAVR